MSKAIKSDRRIGPDGRPYVEMSAKLLRAAYAWCEKNKDEHLAKAHMRACYALNGVLEFQENWFKCDAGISYRFFDDEVVKGMFMMRDHIGRQILKRAKQEAAKP